MIAAAVLILAVMQEVRVDDVDYDRHLAAAVRSYQAISSAWKKDPVAHLPAATSLVAITESEVLPRWPKLAEGVVVVRATRGIDKGAVTERHDFQPYRLAGEIALAAGRRDLAERWLAKSPSSPALPPAGVDVRPWIERGDFAGALATLDRKDPGLEAARAKVRSAAERHQKARTDALAAVLPRVDEFEFAAEHVEPCLRACAKVPPEFETAELRWARRLRGWLERKESAEGDRLAMEAAGFAADFHAFTERAQEERLTEIAGLVDRAQKASRADRATLLETLGASERGLGELLGALDRPERRARLAALKARLPIDESALDEARGGAASIAQIRRIADDLDRLWTSDRRERLSVPDRRDLALRLGVFRCYALFLDGRSTEDVARDPRVAEVFREADPLPADVSPRVAAVRALLGR